MSRHQERDPLELVRVRLERHAHLFAGEQILRRRLQQIEQAIFKDDAILRRPDTRKRGRLVDGFRRGLRLRKKRAQIHGRQLAAAWAKGLVGGRWEAPAFGAYVQAQLAQRASERSFTKQTGFADTDLK